jgi:hypothetical protein
VEVAIKPELRQYVLALTLRDYPEVDEAGFDSGWMNSLLANTSKIQPLLGNKAGFLQA